MADMPTSDTEDPASMSETTRDEAQSSDEADEMEDLAPVDSSSPQTAVPESGPQVPVLDTLPDSYPGQQWMDDLSATDGESLYGGIQSPFGRSRYERHVSSVSGSVSSLRQKKHNVYIVFNMRKQPAGQFVRGAEKLLPVDAAAAVSLLEVPKELIYASSDKLQGFCMLVIASSNAEKYYLVKTEVDIYCLRICENTTVDDLKDAVRMMWEEDKKKSMPLPRKELDEHIMAEDIYLFLDHQCLEEDKILGLPNLTIVKAVHARPFTWIVYYRWEQYCDKRYIVKCRNIDSLTDAKRKFLAVYCTVEKDVVEKSLEEIWFTQGAQVLTERLLYEKSGLNVFQRIFGGESAELARHYLIREGRSFQYRPVQVESSLEVFVHFAGTDAVLVQIECKLGTARILNEDTVLPISPHISNHQLRSEIAKLVKQDPNSIRIFVGKKKFDDNTDLSKVLKNRHNMITVEQKPKLSLTIQVEYKPPCCVSGEQFALEVYSYDTLSKVKYEVCKRMSVPQHKVDLYFENRVLSDENTLSQNRLRTKDVVRAVVFMNRTLLRVRSAHRQQYEVTVDDCFQSTVREVKLFVQSLDDSQILLPESDVVALYRDRILHDSDTLGEIGISPDCVCSRLVFVYVENVCFTASTSYKGTLTVLQDTGDNHFQYLLAMSNGERLFYDPVTQTEAEVHILLMERRKVVLQHMPVVQGIRLSSKVAKESQALTIRSSLAPRQGALMSPSLEMTSGVQSCSNTPNKTEYVPSQQSNSAHLPAPGSRQQCAVRGQRHRQSSVRFEHNDSDAGICSQDNPDTDSATSPETNLPALIGAKCKVMLRKSNSASPVKGADGASSQDIVARRNRSQSCPPLGVQSIVKQLQARGFHVQSDSESGFRKDVACTSLTRRPDGLLTAWRVTGTEISGPADLVAKALGSALNTDFGDSEKQTPITVNKSGASAGAVVPYRVEEHALADPTFKYISSSIIQHVAEHLGRDGMKLVRRLGVSQDVIEKAEHAHPKDIVEMYVECLLAWCRKNGERANAKTLKEALQKCERKDLVEDLEEMDSQSKS